MNRNDIIRMAQEAGHPLPYAFTLKQLEAFAALVAAEEREACAKVCEELAGREDWEVHECADEIRARGGRD